jgi:hypothetical protein
MIFLLSCAGGWTTAEVLAGFRLRADADGDGVVDAEELPGADSDGDGRLSDTEIVAWLDGPGSAWQPPRWSPPPAKSAGQAPFGEAWFVLESIRQELLAADPSAAVPTPEDMAALGAEEGLTAPTATAISARLAPEATRLGVALP